MASSHHEELHEAAREYSVSIEKESGFLRSGVGFPTVTTWTAPRAIEEVTEGSRAVPYRRLDPLAHRLINSAGVRWAGLRANPRAHLPRIPGDCLPSLSRHPVLLPTR